MASLNDIHRAFRSQLNTYSTDNSIDVAWEGISYSPTEGTLYVEPYFLPASPRQVELIGPSTQDRFEGIYQLNIIDWKTKNTINNIEDQYDLLQTYFGRGTVLSYTNGSGEGITVEINRYYSSDLDKSDDVLLTLPISIEWRCDLWIG
jgi:hypothetical protein